jgi:hypothetical protein
MSANAWWTLWTLTVTTALLVTYLLCSVSASVVHFSSVVYPDVWTVHSSYVRYSVVLTHLFMSVTCSFFVVIQPSVCLPLSLSVITNFFATYDRCDSCPIWQFLLTMISRDRFLLENYSFYIFLLFWGFLPFPVIMRPFPTPCIIMRLIIYTLQILLRRWNEDGWDGRDMWRGGGKRKAYILIEKP